MVLIILLLRFQMLAKKVDTLQKAMEVEAKKMRREVSIMEKEVAAMRVDKEQDNRAKRASRASSHQLPTKYVNLRLFYRRTNWDPPLIC